MVLLIVIILCQGGENGGEEEEEEEDLFPEPTGEAAELLAELAAGGDDEAHSAADPSFGERERESSSDLGSSFLES